MTQIEFSIALTAFIVSPKFVLNLLIMLAKVDLLNIVTLFLVSAMSLLKNVVKTFDTLSHSMITVCLHNAFISPAVNVTCFSGCKPSSTRISLMSSIKGEYHSTIKYS